MSRLSILLVILLSSRMLYAAEKDSVELAMEKLEEALQNDFESYCDRKSKKIIHHRILNLKEQAGIYLPMLVLSNQTFLQSPDVLVYLPVDSLELSKQKTKESREIFFIRKCLDDPEISFLHFKGLLQVYFHDYCGYYNFDLTWYKDDASSYGLFKLLCYHLLEHFFPDNASFKFIIGRWHYNHAVDLLNNIEPNESERNIREIQHECVDEMYLALPWFAAAAKMYPPFQNEYEEILEKLGLK